MVCQRGINLALRWHLVVMSGIVVCTVLSLIVHLQPYGSTSAWRFVRCTALVIWMCSSMGLIDCVWIWGSSAQFGDVSGGDDRIGDFLRAWVDVMSCRSKIPNFSEGMKWCAYSRCYVERCVGRAGADSSWLSADMYWRAGRQFEQIWPTWTEWGYRAETPSKNTRGIVNFVVVRDARVTF